MKSTNGGLIVSIIVVIFLISFGIGVEMRKAHNCRDAGWDYHWATEQCLLKGK